MKHIVFGSVFLLIGLILADAQDAVNTTLDCDTYVIELVDNVNALRSRLEAFAYSESALISDLMAYVDLRRRWEDINPPECAVNLHADAISLFANLADTGAFAVAMKFDPLNSRARYFAESVERISTVQEKLSKRISELTGNTPVFEIDIAEELEVALAHIKDEAN